MQELVDIIVNVLSRTPSGNSVKFTKVSDAEFKFEGEGADGVGNGYDYQIDIKYSLKENKDLKEKMEKLNDIKETLKKEDK